MTYQRKVWKFFLSQQKAKPLEWPGQFLYEPWFCERSDAGPVMLRYHSPDILLITPSFIYLFEIKLSEVEEEGQVRRYGRVCEEFFGVPVLLCQVCRNLKSSAGVRKLEELKKEVVNIWHLFL